MRRLTEAWFEFDGVRSDARGLRLMTMPTRPIPAERGEQITVPGRSGFLWMGENGARDGFAIDAEVTTTDAYTPESAAAWLLGKTAFLRFSDEPDMAYEARVSEEFKRSNLWLRFDRQTFTIPFNVQPWRYVWPQPSDIVVTASGTTITNAGTEPSRPRILIDGSGDMTVIIGDNRIDVTGSVLIDSELMDCVDPVTGFAINNRVSLDEFPTLEPGETEIQWSGSVSRVTITPRSRCL